jgi:hypothetical protein
MVSSLGRKLEGHLSNLLPYKYSSFRSKKLSWFQIPLFFYWLLEKDWGVELSLEISAERNECRYHSQIHHPLRCLTKDQHFQITFYALLKSHHWQSAYNQIKLTSIKPQNKITGTITSSLEAKAVKVPEQIRMIRRGCQILL